MRVHARGIKKDRKIIKIKRPFTNVIALRTVDGRIRDSYHASNYQIYYIKIL